MPKVTPFQALRPNQDIASAFCALPYDVYNRAEAKAIVEKNPVSFLAIDRAETSFPDTVDTYAPQVYEKAKEMLTERLRDGTLIREEKPCYYLYELTMKGRVQNGIVACSDVDDYQNAVIKKHENTREEKEIDRINHVDVTNAHTGPIFLIYRAKEELRLLTERIKNEKEALYDFTHEDGVRHRAFLIDDPGDIKRIGEIFEKIPCTYIADGHHRCASAVKVGLKRRKEGIPAPEGMGYNRFLSVLFPDEELYIMPYNRVVKDLNGLTPEEFLTKIRDAGFTVSRRENGGRDEEQSPDRKGVFSLYLEGEWYRIEAGEALCLEDPVKGLDVSILQDHILGPILGIGDPRTDKRIDFVGGIRGNGELVRRCQNDMKLAFAMYPTSIGELLAVADKGLLMPPKSTWFEPKLLSGMFIHSLDD